MKKTMLIIMMSCGLLGCVNDRMNENVQTISENKGDPQKPLIHDRAGYKAWLNDSSVWPKEYLTPVYSDCDILAAAFTTKENCDMCPNREYKDHHCFLKSEHYLKEHSEYRPCSKPHLFITTKEECDKCPNRYMYDGERCVVRCEGGFYDYRGRCKMCDDKNTNIWTYDNLCTKCPNRKMDKTREIRKSLNGVDYVGYCILKDSNK